MHQQLTTFYFMNAAKTESDPSLINVLAHLECVIIVSKQ